MPITLLEQGKAMFYNLQNSSLKGLHSDGWEKNHNNQLFQHDNRYNGTVLTIIQIIYSFIRLLE